MLPDLSELGRVAIEQDRSFSALLEESGTSTSHYRPLPDAPPLCFIDVPTAADDWVAEYMRSMFAGDDIAPARRSVEFEELRNIDRRYRLYSGHLESWQLDLLPPHTQLFTIVADPFDIAHSLYLLAQGVGWSSEGLPDDPAERRVELFRRVDFLSAVATDEPFTRALFRDTLLRQFGSIPDEAGLCEQLADDSLSLEKLRRPQWARTMALLDRISIVGERADVDAAVLLLAASRSWPAPPLLSSVREGDQEQTAYPMANNAARQQFSRMNPYDYRLFDRARQKAKSIRSELTVLCGAATPEAVNKHHVRRFYETATAAPWFDLRADMPWNGIGWGLPQRYGSGALFREMADGRSASVLALLDPSIGDYTLFAQIWEASSNEVLDGLVPEIAGRPLERRAVGWHSEKLVIEWRLPSSVIAGVMGRAEIVFANTTSGSTARSAEPHRLTFGRIGCVPAS